MTSASGEAPVESIHLASTHRAFDTRIFQKECRTLARAGYRVTLIVPHERDEVVDGIRIRAVPVPASGRDRLLKTTRQVYRAALEENPRAIFHFHDAELLVGMLMLKLRGRRVVYDAHENTPQQVHHQHWIPKRLRPPVALAMRLLEYLGGRLFDGVVAAVPGIAARFPAEKTVTVHNYPMQDELVAPEAAPYAGRPPHVAYVGGISEVRGVRELVEATAELPPDLGARLVLAGAFYPAALHEEMQRHEGWRRVDFEGWLSREDVGRLLGRVRAGLVVLHPTEQYVDSYPTKLFEYMSAGLPVVASDFPVWRAFVEDAGCGLLVDPHDPAAIAGAVRWILEHPEEAEAMGRRGREAALRRYNWAHEAERLLAFYETLGS